MDLDKIKQQYQGATLADLIRSHMKTLNKDILPQVIRGTMIEFESAQRETLDHYIDEYVIGWKNRETMNNDLAEIYDKTIQDAKMFILKNNLALSDNRIFDIFHVTTLKLTRQAYNDASLMNLITDTQSH